MQTMTSLVELTNSHFSLPFVKCVHMVPMVRLELTRPFGHQILSLGCLPIPSQRQIWWRGEYIIAAVCNPHWELRFGYPVSTRMTGPLGGDSGTRTHKPGRASDFESDTYTNSIISPNITHFEGCAPLSAASRKQLAFPAGSLPSYHPCINLAPHSGPFRASAHDWRASFLAFSLPNHNAAFRDSLTTYLKVQSCPTASESLTIMTIFCIIA